MGNPIAEALVRNRMKKRLMESTEERVTPEDLKKLEAILNYQLGDYETGVTITGAKIIAKTHTTSTYKVDYDVTIQIPHIDPEDHRPYTDEEVEARSRTITMDIAPKRPETPNPEPAPEVTDNSQEEI